MLLAPSICLTLLVACWFLGVLRLVLVVGVVVVGVIGAAI